MATGMSKYSDISSLIDNFHADALFTLRANSLLARTFINFRGAGLSPRDVSKYSSANVRTAGEGEDVTSTNFDRTLLATLTPGRKTDQHFISDGRVTSDDQNVLTASAHEMGGAFAEQVDTDCATLFASATGGTVGSAGSALTWGNIASARAILQAAKVPGPYWCALHPYLWLDLFNAAATGSEITNAPGFQDSLVNSYFVSTMLGGVTFVISPNIAIDGSDDATGAMYSPLSFAYDERKPFTMETQRDASREGTELNFNMWYAYGVYDATRAVKIIGDATTPT